MVFLETDIWFVKEDIQLWIIRPCYLLLLFVGCCLWKCKQIVCKLYVTQIYPINYIVAVGLLLILSEAIKQGGFLQF